MNIRLTLPFTGSINACVSTPTVKSDLINDSSITEQPRQLHDQ
jgi:hypothetical protein